MNILFLNINKKKFIITLKKENINNNYINNHQLINRNNNIKCAWVHLSCALWNPNIEIGNYEKKRY